MLASGDPTDGADSNGVHMLHEYQVGPPLDAEPMEGNAEASVVRELIARVEELLHRTRRLPAGGAPAWAGTIRFGSVTLEPATQTVLRAGEPVRVTHTDFRLLREVWGAGTEVSRRAVDTHIARLRRKLEDDPANPRHILTALAWGYRFRP
jgi:DNA-binding response OmpR family regulator